MPTAARFRAASTSLSSLSLGVVAILLGAAAYAAPLRAQAALGVSGATVSGQISGMMVRAVPPGSAGANAGLQAGDIIVTFNGTPVTSAEAVAALVRRSQPGDVVKLGIVRGGRTQEATVTLQAPMAGRQPGAVSGRESQAARGVPTVQAASPGSWAGAASLRLGTYTCRAPAGSNASATQQVVITDDSHYALVTGTGSRQQTGEYRFDAQTRAVRWLSGPLKRGQSSDEKDAEYAETRAPAGAVLTLYAGKAAIPCRLGP